MSFNLLADKSLEPTLAEMTETAIKVLSKGNNGYFLFVEGGLIDWAHHGNAAHLSLDETVMLSESVRRAVALTSRRDTLIVVTADHSHTMTISGYARRGSDILGHPLTAADGMPYSTLSYANGPSAKNNDTTTGRRRDMTDDNPRELPRTSVRTKLRDFPRRPPESPFSPMTSIAFSLGTHPLAGRANVRPSWCHGSGEPH